jgi:hypothetical protein
VAVHGRRGANAIEVVILLGVAGLVALVCFRLFG